jgi:DNA-binding MarR family transcriptional regulator
MKADGVNTLGALQDRSAPTPGELEPTRNGAQVDAESAPRAFPKRMGELLLLLEQRGERLTFGLITEAGLTLPQWVTLNLLHWAGAQSVTGIAEKLGLTSATASHLVERLVKAKFVERTEDPEDRRLKRVEISAAGRTLVTKMEAFKQREWEARIAELSPQARLELEHALACTVAELKEKNASARQWLDRRALGLGGLSPERTQVSDEILRC